MRDETKPAMCQVGDRVNPSQVQCVKIMAAVLWSPRTASKPVQWLKREPRRGERTAGLTWICQSILQLTSEKSRFSLIRWRLEAKISAKDPIYKKKSFPAAKTWFTQTRVSTFWTNLFSSKIRLMYLCFFSSEAKIFIIIL